MKMRYSLFYILFLCWIFSITAETDSTPTTGFLAEQLKEFAAETAADKSKTSTTTTAPKTTTTTASTSSNKTTPTPSTSASTSSATGGIPAQLKEFAAEIATKSATSTTAPKTTTTTASTSSEKTTTPSSATGGISGQLKEFAAEIATKSATSTTAPKTTTTTTTSTAAPAASTTGLLTQQIESFAAKLTPSQIVAANKTSHLVYVENHTGVPLTTTVATLSASGSGAPVIVTTGVNDKDWLHLNDLCIDYVTFSTNTGTLTWKFPTGTNDTCLNLSFSITMNNAGVISVTKVTSDANNSSSSGIFTGPAITGYSATFAVYTPAQAADANKTSHQVYIKNYSSTVLDVHVNTIPTITQSLTGDVIYWVVDLNDEEWVHLNNGCINSITIQNFQSFMQLNWPANTTLWCSNVSLGINVNSSGQLTVQQATDDLNFAGNPIAFTITYPSPPS